MPGRGRLCQQTEETPQLAQVVFGLWAFYLDRAEYQTALELAEQFLTLAHRAQDSALLLVAHSNLAQTAFCLGELVRARSLFEQGLAYYDPQPHRALILRYARIPAVASLSWLAWSLWLLGYPDQGEQKTHAVFTLAQSRATPSRSGVRWPGRATSTCIVGMGRRPTRTLRPLCSSQPNKANPSARHKA